MRGAERGAWVAQEDAHLVARLDALLLLCYAVAHGRTQSRIAELAALPEEAVLDCRLFSSLLRPAYTLFRHDASRSLVLCLRGTQSLRDTLTCLTAATAPHHYLAPGEAPVLGFAHSGFLTAARWLLDVTAVPLRRACTAYPTYSLQARGRLPEALLRALVGARF